MSAPPPDRYVCRRRPDGARPQGSGQNRFEETFAPRVCVAYSLTTRPTVRGDASAANVRWGRLVCFPAAMVICVALGTRLSPANWNFDPCQRPSCAAYDLQRVVFNRPISDAPARLEADVGPLIPVVRNGRDGRRWCRVFPFLRYEAGRRDFHRHRLVSHAVFRARFTADWVVFPDARTKRVTSPDIPDWGAPCAQVEKQQVYNPCDAVSGVPTISFAIAYPKAATDASWGCVDPARIRLTTKILYVRFRCF